MPKKKHVISEEERRKRLREAVRELGTSNDTKDFEKAFNAVAVRSPKQRGRHGKNASD